MFGWIKIAFAEHFPQLDAGRGRMSYDCLHNLQMEYSIWNDVIRGAPWNSLGEVQDLSSFLKEAKTGD